MEKNYFASVVFEVLKDIVQKPKYFHTYTYFEASKSALSILINYTCHSFFGQWKKTVFSFTDGWPRDRELKWHCKKNDSHSSVEASIDSKGGHSTYFFNHPAGIPLVKTRDPCLLFLAI